MRVLFDYQIFSTQKYGGISRYFANLHYGINALNDSSSKLGLLFTDNSYIENQQLPARAFNKFIKKESRRFKYNKWYCKYLLQQNNFDVFHPTYYNPYFLKLVKKPFVLTVHDLIHELYPQYYLTDDPNTRNYKKKVIERADHIITISECTKNDLLKFYNIDDNKISVIHHGYKIPVSKNLSNDINIDGKYILFVGDRPLYKNFELFIKAASPLILKYSIKVICVGGGNFKPAEMELFIKLNIVNSVQQLTATDDQLVGLYKHALAFIYPSLYEGFGLPVLEAFYNNCPVIMSNTSSLPEVGGDAAVYFDPTDEQSIAFAIEQVVSNDNKQDDLREKGRERLKLFSFETCLQKTLQVYHSLT
jgi:glycosyltransferase involved in cell wall biosynthesis